MSDVGHITAPINNTIFRTGYAGDYIGIAAYAGKAYPIWMDNRNGTWQLYCSPVSTTYSILGDNTVCTTSTNYTINNLPPGATVHWDANPQGIATIDSPNSLQTTLTRYSNGIITLTATVTACGQPFVVQKENIIVGVPTTTCSQIGNGTCYQARYVCASQLNSYQYVVPPGGWGPMGTGYHLEVYGGGHFPNGLTTMDITSNFFSVWIPNNGSYNNGVLIWAMNACGTSKVSGYPPYVVAFFAQNCYGGYYTVSPNPAQSNVTVSLNTSNTDAAHSTFDQVSIYDQGGNLKLIKKFGKIETGTVNIGSLMNGIYIVEISDGTYKEKQQLIVQH